MKPRVACMKMLRTLLVMLLSGPACTFRSTPLKRVPSLDFIRDAEKKHGRVALLAVPALASIGAMTGENPVTFLSSQPWATQAEFFAVCGAIEAFSLSRLGPNFSLREGVTPGCFLKDNSTVSASVDDLETNAGRVAMLVAASWIALGATG